MKILAHGHIKEGKLHIVHRDVFDRRLADLNGKEVNITVERKVRKRSSPQNRYYHACIVPICQQILADFGYNLTNEQAHEFLKANFNTRELVNEKTGEVKYVPMSTTGLTTIEFEEYMERIRIWAYEFAGETIPLPNEQSTLY